MILCCLLTHEPIGDLAKGVSTMVGENAVAEVQAGSIKYRVRDKIFFNQVAVPER